MDGHGDADKGSTQCVNDEIDVRWGVAPDDDLRGRCVDGVVSERGPSLRECVGWLIGLAEEEDVEGS